MIKLSTFLVTLLFGLNAFSGNLVNINITDYGATNDPSVKRQLDQMAQELANQINDQLPSEDANSFVRSSSKAATLSTAGSGTNYYSPTDGILIGLSLGVAADLDGKSLLGASDIKAENINGAGASASFLIGFSPSKFLTSSTLDLSKFRVSIYGMDKSVETSDASLNTSGGGLGISYQHIPSSELAPLVKWGGLMFNSGLRYFHSTVKLNKNFQETGPTSTVDYGGTSVNITPTFDGFVAAGVDSNILTIPLEASTSIELLKVFQFFGGLGLDLNSGTVSGKGKAQGPVTVTTNNPLTGTILAQADMNMDYSHNVETLSSRYFVGAALDLKYLSISAQLNQSLSDKTQGITLGIFSNF